MNLIDFIIERKLMEWCNGDREQIANYCELFLNILYLYNQENKKSLNLIEVIKNEFDAFGQK